MNTHRITRPGMAPVDCTMVFACPDYYVVTINGAERTLPARDGRVVGFTVSPFASGRGTR